MVVVVVAERLLIPNEEAWGSVAESLLHLGECEGDPAYAIELTRFQCVLSLMAPAILARLLKAPA